MQPELTAALDENDLPIEIFGVNESGDYESGNATIDDLGPLPWLQDTPEQRVWTSRWNPVYRDVVILDAQNRFLGRYNLTDHNLANADNYRRLKEKLLRLARREG